MATTSWRWFLLVGTLAVGVVVALPRGLADYLVYVAVAVSAVIAIVVGIRRNGQSQVRAWTFVAAAVCAWVVGDTAYFWRTNSDVAIAKTPFSYAAYLVAYAALTVGLVLLARTRGRGRQATALLDTTILVVGVGLVAWVYQIVPAWFVVGQPAVERVASTANLVVDVVIVAVAVRLATTPGARGTAARLFAGAVGMQLLSDSLLQVAPLAPVVSAHVDVLEAGWLLGYVLWGATALHPEMRTIVGWTPEEKDTMTIGRLVVLACAVMTAPAVLALEVLDGEPMNAWPIVVAATVMVILVLVRIVGMIGQLREQTHRLELLAETDFTTGLANRRRLTESIDAMLRPDHPQHAALFLVDLEGFHEMIATLGHSTGDEILRAVGDRLRRVAGSASTIARMDSDGFAVLDPSITTSDDADALGLRIRATLEDPYVRLDLSVSVQVSIGIAVLPVDATTPTLAVHRAAVALTTAAGRPGRIARYSAEMEPGGALAPQLMSELLAALDRGEIVLHFQPQVELRTGRVFGVEALARWEHPQHGLLGPDAFISAAEQTGLIGPFTQHVLDQALDQCARWRQDGLTLTVAVNLSVRNLLDPGLVADVRDALDRHGLDAGALELEITESSAMVDPRRSLQVLAGLADLGLALSIDDFGTGHSSLAYLQRLPVRRLKIDRSFVAGMVTDPASAAIVTSTVDLARNLRLDVVAEGVEDDETLLCLRATGCFAAQGFGLGRPVPASQVPALVADIERRLPEVLGLTAPAAPEGLPDRGQDATPGVQYVSPTV